MSTAAKAKIESLEAWRNMPQLVAWANRLFNSSQWELLQEIMQNHEHIRLHETPPHITAEKQLGRIEGWDLFLNFLKHAAEPWPNPTVVEATFEPAEIPKAEKE